MSRWLPPVLVLAVAGCSERLPAPPEVSGVSPPAGRIRTSVPLTVEGRFPVRAFADLGGRGPSGVDTTYRAWLGTTELTKVTVVDGRTLEATVPPEIDPGVYDLIVRDPYEREGVLPQAYEALRPATALAFTSPPQTVAIGVCSTPLTFELRDEVGARATADAELTISVSASPSSGLSLFADAACSQPLASLLQPAGVPSGQLYFRGTVPGTVPITAAAPGLTPATQTQTITLVATTLAFTTLPQTVDAGTCSSRVGLELQDAAGSAAAAANDVRIGLAASALPDFALFSDACTTSTSSVTVPRGTTSVDFTFRGTTPGVATITASATGFPDAQQDATIVAGPPSKLVFLSSAQTLAAGGCSSTATVQVRDAFGNPAPVTGTTPLSFASTSSGNQFFASAGCAGSAVTGASVNAGAATATFWFRDSTPGTPTLTVSASGLADATQVQTILGPDGGVDGSVDAGSADAGPGTGDGGSTDGGPAADGGADAGSLVLFKTGTFSKTPSTGSASQTVPHNLGVQPRALLLWTVGTTDAGLQPGYAFAMGMSDGLSSWSVAAANEDGVNFQNTARAMLPAALSIVQFPAFGLDGVLAAQAQLTSWDANNLELAWTMNTTQPTVIHYLVIGGSSVQAKALTWTAPADAGPYSVSGMSFQPDVVLHFWLGDQYDVQGVDRRAYPGIGVMDGDGGQWSVESGSGDGSSNANTLRSQWTDRAIHMSTNQTTLGHRATYQSMNPDGFTVNFTTVNGFATRVLSFGLAGVNAQTCVFNKPGGSGSQSYSNATFRPQFLLLASYQDVAMPGGSTTLPNSRLGLGMSDGTSAASIAWDDEDLATRMRVRSIDSPALFTKMNNSLGTVDAEATLTSFQPSGFSLNWLTNETDPTQLLCLMLGSSGLP